MTVTPEGLREELSKPPAKPMIECLPPGFFAFLHFDPANSHWIGFSPVVTDKDGRVAGVQERALPACIAGVMHIYRSARQQAVNMMMNGRKA